MLPTAPQPPDPGASARSPHVVVLGGGVCGLYAARTLVERGVRVTVLEKSDVVGGLAAGHLRQGNYYDLGAHHLHAFDKAIFEDIRSIMGERLIPSEKAALIRYGRGYRRYPLEFTDLLRGIPPWSLARAMAGMLWQQGVNRIHRSEPANAEEALIRLYGRPLYGFFFRDFTHRYWGIPPTELSAAFVRSKMPRLSAVDIVKKALGRFGLKEAEGAAVEGALAKETLWYSRTGAREMPMALAGFVQDHGGTVLTESPFLALEHRAGRVVAVRHRLPGGGEARLACDAVINTISLPSFVKALRPPAPEAVLAAADSLRYRPMVVFGLLVSKPSVLGALYVYYRERIFHRVAEPSASGMRVHPEGHSVLLCEMMCEKGDDRWLGGEATRERLVADLVAEGLIQPQDIVEMHLIQAEFAYPVFSLGFERHVDLLRAHIDTLANAWSVGRQGGFCYPNMHNAMRMGADAAEDAVAYLKAGPAFGHAQNPLTGEEEDGVYLPDGDMPASLEPASSQA